MNELSKVVNAQLQQAAENLVRNRLMSDEFLDFVQENTKPLDTLMAYYKCAIMEVETKFKVLNEQFSLEYDLKKEKQRAEIMKSKAFYGRLYDMTSEEFAEYERYKKLFSGYGIGLYIIACCIAEMSDEYFTRLKKRDESNYAIAWGAFNEYSTLSSELMASVPYYEKARVRETMDVNIGVSGMIDPDDKDKTWVVDTCEFHNAQSVIQYDFFRGMQHGRAPFRCHHCGRFFLATDSYKTFYCNEKSPENPNRTCRQIGAKNKHKEKAENNPIIQTISHIKPTIVKLHRLPSLSFTHLILRSPVFHLFSASCHGENLLAGHSAGRCTVLLCIAYHKGNVCTGLHPSGGRTA